MICVIYLSYMIILNECGVSSLLFSSPLLSSLLFFVRKKLSRFLFDTSHKTESHHALSLHCYITYSFSCHLHHRTSLAIEKTPFSNTQNTNVTILY
jgi:hypothetical protein